MIINPSCLGEFARPEVGEFKVANGAIVLSIAHSTVDVHRRNIMRKIGFHKTAEITKYAIQKELIFV